MIIIVFLSLSWKQSGSNVYILNVQTWFPSPAKWNCLLFPLINHPSIITNIRKLFRNGNKTGLYFESSRSTVNSARFQGNLRFIIFTRYIYIVTWIRQINISRNRCSDRSYLFRFCKRLYVWCEAATTALRRIKRKRLSLTNIRDSHDRLWKGVLWDDVDPLKSRESTLYFYQRLQNILVEIFIVILSRDPLASIRSPSSLHLWRAAIYFWILVKRYVKFALWRQ